jgi:Phosphotransferase enzyme family
VAKTFAGTPDALTADWLSGVLGRRVAGIRVERFAAGVGVIGQVTRLHIEYVGEPGPPALIAKFPAANAQTRAVAALYDMYGREHRFYTELRDRVPVRTPHCYFSAHRKDDESFVLLLEDLSAFRVGDQLVGASVAQARRVLEQMAALHAAFWHADRHEPHLAWVPVHDNPSQVGGMQAGFALGWPVVVERLSELVPPSARAGAGKVHDAVPALLRALCREPLALVHADMRLDNLFFDGDEVALVDWQSVCFSAPEQDVAYFLTQSLTDDVRRAHADALLRHYHASLIARGVRDYSFDRLIERYRVAALYLVCYAVTIAGTLDMGNARGKSLAAALLGRCLRSIEEVDGWELLERVE